MEPEELRAEKRWSNIPQHSAPNGYWAKHLDEKLLVLVTNATASGDRFPVGVNWLDISRSIGYSPVECLKRYAFLHSARERLSMQGEAPVMGRIAARTQQTTTPHGDADSTHTYDTNNPFSGMSSSDDLGSPSSRAFLEYGSPIASPRLQSLENSGEFGVSGAPDSPPPFALRAAYKGERGGVTVTSPVRWESLAKETYSSSPPVLSAPPHVLRQQQLRTSFGVVGTEDPAMKKSTYEGIHSPRIVHGTQHHSRFTDPNFAAEIVNDAFRGLRLGDDLPPPTATSPRMARAISNSEFPFLSEDDRKSKPTVAPPVPMGARVGARRGSDAGPIPPHPLRHAASPGSSMLSSFQTDNPFSESLTQSALEEAFLDMAGSRLDASSMLFASRYPASQSRVMNEPPQHQSKPLHRDPSSLSRHQSWSHPQQRQ